MKLDYDCLRSLLLKLEDFENLDGDLHYQYTTLNDMAEALPEFPKKHDCIHHFESERRRFDKCKHHERRWMHLCVRLFQLNLRWTPIP